MNKNSVFGFGLVSLVALASACTLSKETGNGAGGGDTGGAGGGNTVDCDHDNDGSTVMYVAECEGVGDNLDCNDLDGSVHLGAPEICGDGIDNNCNGQVDENCVCQNGATQSCYTGSANTRNVGTCHDGVQTCVNNAWGACLGSVTPVSEVCGNATDENCNGQVNDGCGNGLVDADGDGYYGNDPNPALDDCNDNNPGVHPNAAEICSDNVDNNCNGSVDEGCGVCANWAIQSCYTGPANTRNVGACHDGSQVCTNGAWGACLGSATPVSEVCGNGTDENCNGQVNEGCGGGLIDADGDGYYGNDPNPALDDCNDTDPSVHPGAQEICGDGIDNNCSGAGDEGCIPVTVCYHLTPPAGTTLNVAQMNWWSPGEDDCILTVFDGQNHVACPATYYAGTPVIFSADAIADGIFYHPFDTCGMPAGTQSVGSVWITKGQCADNGPGIWNATTGPWQDNPDNLACTRNGYFIVPNP